MNRVFTFGIALAILVMVSTLATAQNCVNCNKRSMLSTPMVSYSTGYKAPVSYGPSGFKATNSYGSSGFRTATSYGSTGYSTATSYGSTGFKATTGYGSTGFKATGYGSTGYMMQSYASPKPVRRLFAINRPVVTKTKTVTRRPLFGRLAARMEMRRVEGFSIIQPRRRYVEKTMTIIQPTIMETVVPVAFETSTVVMPVEVVQSQPVFSVPVSSPAVFSRQGPRVGNQFLDYPPGSKMYARHLRIDHGIDATGMSAQEMDIAHAQAHGMPVASPFSL